MMKIPIVISLIAAAITMHASDFKANQQLRFTDLPYSEGKLFVAISCGKDRIQASAIEVESDSVVIPIDLSKYVGKEIKIEAFQDLNENDTLDFDSYGRPKEPCLQTNVTPEAENEVFDFKLIQY